MNAITEYLLLIVISLFLAHQVGTAYGELTQGLLGEIVLRLERVQATVR